MLSAWTTMILVQSSTVLGDTQDTVSANHEIKYQTDLFFVRTTLAGLRTRIAHSKQFRAIALDRSAAMTG